MAIISSIAISLGLNTAKFQEELKKTQTSLKKFQRQFKRAFRGLRSTVSNITKSIFSFKSALVAVAGATGIGLLIKSSLDSISVLGKTASKLGATTEGLISLRLAAKEASNMASGQFDTALQRMTRRIAEAAAGTGEAQAAIKELGLNANELNLMPADKAFIQIANSMKNVEGASNKLRLSFKLFDSEGAGLVNTLNLGADGLMEYMKTADQLGLLLSSKAVKGVEETADSVDRLFLLAKGLKDQITAALAPAINTVVKAFQDWIIEAAKAKGGIRNLAKDMAVSLLEGIKRIAEGFQTIISRATEAAHAIGLINDPKQEAISMLQQEIAGYDEILARYEKLNLKSVDTTNILKERQVAQQALINLQNNENTALTNGINLLNKMIEDTKKLNTERGGGTTGGGGDNTEAQRLAAIRDAYGKAQVIRDEYLKNGIIQLTKASMTELETIRTTEFMRGEMIRDARQRGIISRQREADLLTQIHEDAERKRVEATKRAEEQQFQIRQRNYANTASILTSLATLSGTESKKQFERNKKFARAAVIVDTAGGIMKAFNSGLPYPVAVLAAIAVGLKGAAQLGTINRTQFGGGGSISVGGGGGISSAPVPSIPAPPVPIQQGARSDITINIQSGAVVGIDDFQSAVEEAVRAGSDAERLNITVLGERAEVA